MEKTDKIWLNGQLVPWDEAKVHVLTHTLHYGSGAMEGIRMYKTPKGSALFQLDRHIDRLYYGADSLKMKVPWSKEEFKQAILETIKANNVEVCYVRPILYYGYGELRVGPSGCPVEGSIAVWPWGAYLPAESVKIKTSTYIRIHPKTSVTDAKITGHYVNSILSGYQATDNGYHEALQLDYQGNIAEGPGENFFIVNGKTIITPPLGTILAGITRESVIELAKDLGYEVKEEAIKLEEAYKADECFFTGTAAEVTPIGSIDDKAIKNEIGPVTKHLKEEFSRITNAENKKYYKWLTFIE